MAQQFLQDPDEQHRLANVSRAASEPADARARAGEGYMEWFDQRHGKAANPFRVIDAQPYIEELRVAGWSGLRDKRIRKGDAHDRAGNTFEVMDIEGGAAVRRSYPDA